MIPEVLIVENDPEDLEDAVDLLNNIDKFDKGKYGIDSFQIADAKWGSKAVELLEQAGQNNRLFDIVLLDLQLPDQKGGALEADKGFALLQKARELGAAFDVVIYTAYSGYTNLLRALREGAADFISKSSSDAEKQTRVLGAWRRAQEKKSDQMLEQRVRKLIPYAERAVAQRFTPYFSNFVQSIVDASEKIEDYGRTRYGLDPERDSQDSLVQALTMHRQTVKTAQKQWSSLQSEMSPAGAELGTETVEVLLKHIHEDLKPCLMIKETTLILELKSETNVQSFGNDIGAVLREIVTGTLSDLPNHGIERRINVTVETNHQKKRAEVKFKDDLDHISPSHAKTVNDGLNVIDDKSFGRLWGLQVAQQIAMRGGGRLHVQPGPEQGNLVTCFIPLA
jgi:CheY-like chemotaxis protein